MKTGETSNRATAVSTTGVAIRLADGRHWVLEVLHEENLDRQRELFELLDGIDQAEDCSEQRRAELALAIHLLDLNYSLSPFQMRKLLEFDSEDPELPTVQKALHKLAERVAKLFPRPRAAAIRSLIADG